MRYQRRRLSFLAAAALLSTVMGVHGAEMQLANADSSVEKPLTGEWTQNGSYVWSGTARTAGVHHAFDATITFDLPDAPGNAFVGHSVAKLRVLINADGSGTMKGFDMFIGSVDGRPGQSMMEVEATISNFTDYKGTAHCVGGADGLKNLKCLGGFMGRTGVGGHWTDGSYSFD